MKRRPGPGPRVELKHLGGLDGLRGVAVLGVILYHAGFGAAQGGFLGVEVFFVLSGFLITSLLLEEWRRSGAIALARFWGRRARRLLPALFAVVLVIGVYYAIAGASQAVPGFFGDGLSALLYYSNWHQIAVHTSYFAASGPVSPFQHTWSLAIEEQFYVIWPLVVLGVLWAVFRRSPSGSPVGRIRLLLTLTLVGLVASIIDSALLFDGGRGLDRVYYGTDTRASGLLAGAALAMILAVGRERAAEGRQRLIVWRPGLERGLSRASFWLLAGIIFAMELANGSAGWLYPYGFVLVDLASVGLIAAVALMPGSVADRMLSAGPLQFVGRISYGLYLWHFPLFLWLDASATGLSGLPLFLLRVTLTFAVSIVSYVVIEQPIRRRRMPSIGLRWVAPAGAAGSLVSLLVAATASSLPTGVPAAATVPSAPPKLSGSGTTCTVRLNDTPAYGLAAVAPSQEATFEYQSLGRHTLHWSGSGTKTFSTCPPKRVLLVGDSIAFSLGVPMLADEQRYGVEVANAAILGCAFSTRGELDVNGTWEPPSDGCPNAISQWAAAERSFHPQEVIVELGYRDEFDWRWNGSPVQLGQSAFDAYVQSQIDRLVQVLGSGGTKILFLTVPFTHPPDQPDGSPAPAASPARHATINAMLARAAAKDRGNAAVLDIDQTISPGGHYNARIGGQMCRFDGIHFTVFCAELLEPKILGSARALLGN